jgi:hypothetical protein
MLAMSCVKNLIDEVTSVCTTMQAMAVLAPVWQVASLQQPQCTIQVLPGLSNLIRAYSACVHVDGALMDRLRKSLTKHLHNRLPLSKLPSCGIAASRAAVSCMRGLRIISLHPDVLYAPDMWVYRRILWFSHSDDMCHRAAPGEVRLARPYCGHTVFLHYVTSCWKPADMQI